MTMTADTDDQFRDLLDRWEDLREQGQEPSVEELCRDAPHLVERMREWTRVLKSRDWISRRADEVADETLGEAGSPHRRGEGQAPDPRRVRLCWRNSAAAGWGGCSRRSTAR